MADEQEEKPKLIAIVGSRNNVLAQAVMQARLSAAREMMPLANEQSVEILASFSLMDIFIEGARREQQQLKYPKVKNHDVTGFYERHPCRRRR